MTVQDDRVAEFHRLHASGCFVMPNPWDVGSARALEQLGFPALATTSAGFAWTLGRADNQVTLEQALEHLRVVAAAVDVPVNADFEGGFAVDPDDVAANVKLAAATGIAGLSIEDSTGDEAQPLHEFDLAVERVRGGAPGDRRERHRRRAHRLGPRGSSSGAPTSTRRSGGCARTPRPAPTASTRRGSPPSSRSSAVVAAVAPKPVNLLINAPFITVAEAAALGVRRISVGGTLARTAWGGSLLAAQEIADGGDVLPVRSSCRTSTALLPATR